jgi:hypothetical protein
MERERLLSLFSPSSLRWEEHKEATMILRAHHLGHAVRPLLGRKGAIVSRLLAKNEASVTRL